MMRLLPPELAASLEDDELAAACDEQFTVLDTDGNGSLSPNELGPIISQLANTESVGLTPEHCQRFATEFDADGNGDAGDASLHSR